LIDLVNATKERIFVLRKLLSATPPVALTLILSEKFPAFIQTLVLIRNQELSIEKEALVAQLDLWNTQSYSIDDYEYYRRVILKFSIICFCCSCSSSSSSSSSCFCCICCCGVYRQYQQHHHHHHYYNCF